MKYNEASQSGNQSRCTCRDVAVSKSQQGLPDMVKPQISAYRRAGMNSINAGKSHCNVLNKDLLSKHP